MQGKQLSFRLVLRGTVKTTKGATYQRKTAVIHAADIDEAYAKAEQVIVERKLLKGFTMNRFNVLPPLGE